MLSKLRTVSFFWRPSDAIFSTRDSAHRVPEQASALVDGKRIHLTQGAKGEAKNDAKLQQNRENNNAPSHTKASDIPEQPSVVIQSEPLINAKDRQQQKFDKRLREKQMLPIT